MRQAMNDSLIMTLKGSGKFLALSYDAVGKEFVLRGSDGNVIFVPAHFKDRDWLTFAISQSGTVRELFVHSFSYDKIWHKNIDAVPIGVFTELHCSPSL
jgi:hypothetical protein